MPQTKKVLAASLKELLQTKPLDKITVKQLVEVCEINRQTFYYHFHDIYELVEYMFLVELEKMLKHLSKIQLSDEKYLCERTYYIILSFLSQNKIITMNVFHSIGKQKLEDVLYEISYSLIMQFLDRELKGMHVSDEEKMFIANFYKFAIVGITLEWIKGLMRIEPEVMVRRVSYIIAGDVKRELHRN